MNKKGFAFVVVPIMLACALGGLCAAAGVYVFNHHAQPMVETVVK